MYMVQRKLPVSPKEICQSVRMSAWGRQRATAARCRRPWPPSHLCRAATLYEPCAQHAVASSYMIVARQETARQMVLTTPRPQAAEVDKAQAAAANGKATLLIPAALNHRSLPD